MKRVLFVAVAALALAAAAVQPAGAQELRLGLQANYGTFSELGLGARAEMGLDHLVENLSASLSFDYFFESSGTDYYDHPGTGVRYHFPYDKKLWSISANAIYDLALIPVEETFKLYAGGGVNYSQLNYTYEPRDYYNPYVDPIYQRRLYSHKDDDDGFGLNLIAGCRFDLDIPLVPYAELRYTTGVADEFILSAGAYFSTGLGQ